MLVNILVYDDHLLTLERFNNNMRVCSEYCLNDVKFMLNFSQEIVDDWPAADSDDTVKLFRLFRSHWPDIPPPRVAARGIVEALDVIENI